MQLFVFLVLLATGAWCEQLQVTGVTNGGDKIGLDVSLEEDFMMVLTGRQSDPPQPAYTQTINLYDFTMHLEARKLANEGICYIRTFNASYEETRQVLQAAQMSPSKELSEVSEDWNIEGEEIEETQLEETVGEKITHFCSGYKVVWAGTIQDLENQAPTAVSHKVKRSPQRRRIGGNGSIDHRGVRGHVQYQGRRWSGRVQGERRWNGDWNAQGSVNYRGRHTTGNARLGYDSRNGYSASGRLNYERGNISAGAQVDYNRHQGLSASAGVRIRF